MIFDGRYFAGADREADLTFAKQGTLRKIIYPTGGSSTLEYELHRYTNFPLDEFYQFDPTLTPVMDNLSYTIPNVAIPVTYSDSETFSLTENTDVIIKYKIPV